MRRTIWLALAVLVLVPGLQAKWISFDRNMSVDGAAVKAAGSASNFEIAVEIPGVDVSVDDGYTFVTIPDAALRMIKDEPELPLVTTSIMLPHEGNPSVELVVVDERTVSIDEKLAPSKGHLTRDIDISTVARVEGDVYEKNAPYPAKGYAVEVGDPYICRDIRGAAIRICPVRYNPVEGTVHVLKSARLKVSMTRSGDNELSKIQPSIDSAFAAIYKKLYVNFDIASKNWTDIDETTGRAIIICPDEWIDNLAPLQEWRATKGLESKVVAVSSILGEEESLTGEMLKDYIQSEYDAGNLTWVQLVGDADVMPPLRGENENAHSDACLVKCAGDDHIPDAFISRFSCNSAEELDVQVARAVAYESNPVTGEAAAFYRKAVGIASNQGHPSDKERADWLRDIELAWNFDEVDQIYDPSANAEMVSEAVNEGRSLINYIGHGSKTMWVSSRFNVNDVHECTNDAGQWPMIWSVACVNGDFAYGSDCFGEAWAKAGTAEAPKGAIGLVAASTNMAWVPPCVWQKAIIEDYMVTEEAFTGGAQHHYGCLKACEEYGYNTSSRGIQIVEQCIYFGDGSVVLRNDVPREATVSLAETTERGLTLKVSSGEENLPVKGARVVVATELQGGMVGTTNEEGIVKLESATSMEKVEALSVTVTGPNLVPLINEAVERCGDDCDSGDDDGGCDGGGCPLPPLPDNG